MTHSRSPSSMKLAASRSLLQGTVAPGVRRGPRRSGRPAASGRGSAPAAGSRGPGRSRGSAAGRRTCRSRRRSARRVQLPADLGDPDQHGVVPHVVGRERAALDPLDDQSLVLGQVADTAGAAPLAAARNELRARPPGRWTAGRRPRWTGARRPYGRRCDLEVEVGQATFEGRHLCGSPIEGVRSASAACNRSKTR